jgi:hypothetical protein
MKKNRKEQSGQRWVFPRFVGLHSHCGRSGIEPLKMKRFEREFLAIKVQSSENPITD